MSDSEDDVVEMSFPKWGITIDKWLSYAANSHFTTPTDGFDFTLAAISLDDVTRDALRRGEEFQIKVNGHVQANGYIDRVHTSASRDRGVIVQVSGCDKLAQVVRSGIDPRTRFTSGQNLLDVLKKVFAPFGYTEDNMLVSNDSNRNVRSGQVIGQKVSKKGKALKNFAIHQTKPYPGEGAFAFASRLSQRFGLWIWLSAEGNVLIVGKPTFDQPPRYKLFDKVTGDTRVTNIEHGDVIEDSSRQPSCIVATGFSYGGEADRSRLKTIVVNELVAQGPDGFAVDSVSKIISDNQDAHQLPLRTVFPTTALHPHPFAQPVYLHDQESQTQEQLDYYARRELAMRQRESLHCSYTVAGHSQNGTIWCVDTIVDVDDDVRGIHEPMWVLSRTFEKSRDGTFTHLELIRPHTMFFGD